MLKQSSGNFVALAMHGNEVQRCAAWKLNIARTTREQLRYLLAKVVCCIDICATKDKVFNHLNLVSFRGDLLVISSERRSQSITHM